ncbi:MAG TPA: LytTR family DNA-binding domain-containing protein [Burkholderiales bacterium]|nr:LytTR family DNA-binding domain-containing protein [Burkholderiales bacterium]
MSAAGPLRVLIVDDEAPARSRLRDLLADCAPVVPTEVVGEAGNGREALDLLAAGEADLVLLDIRMPEMDGIELARHLLTLPRAPAVVFTTAYDAYAIRAFELRAVDYLLKPIRAARLQEALERARNARPPAAEVLRQLAPAPRVHLSSLERGRVQLIPVRDIVYLKAELKYVTARTRDREYLVDESLTRLEEEFGPRFARVHRNCLVARDHVTGFERVAEEGGEGRWVVLLDGVAERLPVSRRQQHVVKDLAG